MPIKTFCPPEIERLEPTVIEANVFVPVPPLKTDNWPLNPKVKTWFRILPVMLVSLVIP